MIWSDLLVPGVPLIEKVMRPLIVYAVLVVLVRVAGKRELAQLNQFDLIVLLTLSNTVQNAIIGNDNSLTGGIIGAVTLIGINSLVVRFMYRHEKLDRLIEGDPVTLVQDGQVMKDCCDRELITVAELEAAAHRQGFESLADVGRAVLEPGGTLSFIGRNQMAGSPPSATHQEIVLRLDEIKRMLAARG
jgi:uncharacterized membrane protein YcaP (DUF421 family)